MKKLMMAAAIVCAAVGVQAAQISWTSNLKSLVNDKGVAQGANLSDYTLVLVNLGSSIDWDNATEIAIGSSMEQTTLNIATATSSKRGRVTGKASFTYDETKIGSNLIDNNDYLALMFKDKDGALSKLYYYDEAGLVEVGDEAVWKVSGLSNNSSSVPATTAIIGLEDNFTANSIPEPTSGLLLLLGMAGLALRRRRA